MYDWLLELQALCQRMGNHTITLAEQGATEAELTALERDLGLSLPASYRQFLSRWNGAEFDSTQILSSQELRDWAEQAGFARFTGDRGATLNSPDAYYRHKPAYHLVFRTFDLGSDVYCLDTRSLPESDCPVCKYDVEFELEDHLKVRHTSFEIMLLSEMRDAAMDGTMLMDAENEMSDAEETLFDQELDQFGQRLTDLLAKQSER